MQVSITEWGEALIYALLIAGTPILGTKLLFIVAEQAAVLALPYLDNTPHKMSLMERRRIEALEAVRPPPGGVMRRVAVLEAPAAPANILAVRLDRAEKEDLGPESRADIASAADQLVFEPSSIAVRAYRRVTHRAGPPHSRHTDVSARDVFNRQFGVMSVADN